MGAHQQHFATHSTPPSLTLMCVYIGSVGSRAASASSLPCNCRLHLSVGVMEPSLRPVMAEPSKPQPVRSGAAHGKVQMHA